VANQIDQIQPFMQDVILDDRMTTTVGKKLMEAKRVGYPYIIVVGKKSSQPVPLVELHDLNQNTQNVYTVAELFDYLKQTVKN
jgi:prolyl-tRNA synthetase